MLQVENLCVENENHFQVVKNVSFSIRAGEILAIAGVSGNGQVELADAIAGLLPAAGGRILLNGKDITHESIRKRTLEGISYIPEDRQRYGLVLDFMLEENMGMKSYFKEPFSKNGILKQEEFSKYSSELIEKYMSEADREIKLLSGL